MHIVEVDRRSSQDVRYMADGRPVDVSHAVHMIDGRRVWVFYDQSMELLYEPSCFMTIEYAGRSRNTADQAASALSLLLAFSSMVGVGFPDFGRAEALGFLMFLRGTVSEGVLHSFDLKTMRSESTVEAYVKCVRAYAAYLGLGESPFLERGASNRGRWHMPGGPLNVCLMV